MTSRDMGRVNRRAEVLFRAETLKQTVGEIARSMGVSHPAAAMLLHRAKADPRAVEAARLMAKHKQEEEDRGFN